MYICRKCNTEVKDSDRFCSGCGAYMGEPAAKQDNWQTVNGLSEDYEVHTKAALENSVDEVKEQSELVLHAPFEEKHSDLLKKIIYKTDFKSIVRLTITAALVVSLLLALIANLSFNVPNDLVDVILPFNLVPTDFKTMLNLPGSVIHGFIFSLHGFALTALVLFGCFF